LIEEESRDHEEAPMKTRLGLVGGLLGAVCLTGVAHAIHVTTGIFVPIAPCRIVDTRFTQLGADPLAAGETRFFHVVGSNQPFTAQGGTAGGCGIPPYSLGQPQVEAVLFNFVAVGPTGPGHLTAWGDPPIPDASVLNYTSAAATGGLNIANAVLLPISQDQVAGDDLAVRASVSSTHLVIDVMGYVGRQAQAQVEVLSAGPLDDRMVLTANGLTWANVHTGRLLIGYDETLDELVHWRDNMPGSDNTLSLGRSGARWLAVWATDGTINTSDGRLKTDVEPLGYGLADLRRLRPVRYRWSVGGADRPHLGLIAQEVREVVPEVVVVGDDEQSTLGMSYSELVPVLVRAIQELDAEVQRLRAGDAGPRPQGESGGPGRPVP
jgi:hypothetical protein